MGWVLASESPALDVIGATFVRELEPGEMVVIDGKEVRSERPFPAERLDPKLCIFEFVYFARPDTTLYGNEVHGARRRMGELLAAQAPVEADLVMGVPDSGVPAAEGYAVASGIPYGQGLVKNRYIGRTFIAPTQAERANGVRRKLNPLRENIAGKRVIVVDDSIVRGTTTRAMVTMLREAGATEVHLRISSPPFRWPCFYGIDTPDRTELLAAIKSIDRDRRVPGRRLARVPDPRQPGRRHRRPRGRVLRRLPDRQLPGAGARGARRAHGTERGGQRDAGVSGAAPGPDPATVPPRPRTDSARRPPTPRPASTSTPASGPSSGSARWWPPPSGPRCSGARRLRRPVRPGHRRATASPVLVAGTDGVGTKALVAQAAGRFDTIGIDLVAMCVDDLVCLGAEPLFLLDYISTGDLDPGPDGRAGGRGGRRLPPGRAPPCSAARWPSTPG